LLCNETQSGSAAIATISTTGQDAQVQQPQSPLMAAGCYSYSALDNVPKKSSWRPDETPIRLHCIIEKCGTMSGGSFSRAFTPVP
jgi:hypothetical protein